MMCADSSTISSVPRAPRITSAISFAIVAVGTYTAASWPSSAAVRRSSSVTVGSSNHCSSPTSARAIASRIAADGRVIVSDRRSIISLRLHRLLTFVADTAGVRKIALVLAGAAVLGAPAAAAAPLVPPFIQGFVAKRAGATAYVPTRAPLRYEYASYAWDAARRSLTIRLVDK